MSQENVETLRRGFEHFRSTGDMLGATTLFDPDFVWDMSTFRGWPERQTYAGIDEVREFMAEWLDAWEDWDFG